MITTLSIAKTFKLSTLFLTCCACIMFCNAGILTAAGPDDYEPDNSADEATVIFVDYPEAQIHNFHTPDDIDFVRFVATAGKPYTITTRNLGQNCDTKITLYDTDGTTALKERDDYFSGEDEYLEYNFTDNGTYYVGIRNVADTDTGSDTRYELTIILNTATGGTGQVSGYITDARTGAPLSDVMIVSGCTSTLSSKGGFFMLCSSGTYCATATKECYVPQQFCFDVISGDVTSLDIELQPTPGDCACDNSTVCCIEKLLVDEPQCIETFRLLRDRLLSGSALGRRLIDMYYKKASAVNDILNSHPTVKYGLKQMLLTVVRLKSKSAVLHYNKPTPF